MGMFIAFMAVVIVILAISAFITAVCFISSGVIMAVLRRKSEGKVKKPWYVIVLRVVGCIASLPLIFSAGLVIYAVIANAIDSRTNLARSVMSYNYEQAEKILMKGADPDVRDKYGRTLLMCIADHDTYISADDEERYECGAGNIYDEADADDEKMMELLLKYGADINAAVTDCGNEENHQYEEGGWTDIYANSEHSCKNTALIYAVRYRSTGVVKFLIDHGADVNAENACGFTPILMCADMRSDDDGGLEIAEMLLNKGADPNAVTNFHQGIMWLLTRQNSEGNAKITALIKTEIDQEMKYE